MFILSNKEETGMMNAVVSVILMSRESMVKNKYKVEDQMCDMDIGINKCVVHNEFSIVLAKGSLWDVLLHSEKWHTRYSQMS